jgi:rRNA-processing protein FCF1
VTLLVPETGRISPPLTTPRPTSVLKWMFRSDVSSRLLYANTARLIVPTSVVRELQFMADKADHDKRERARYGLDVIDQLQAIESVQVAVLDDGVTNQNGVDEQLIVLAKRWQARLCTIDYNLNKSARVQGVQVININELAHALRITYLPGEKLEVKLQQAGQDSHQAVGYLDDGTMVVVDNARQQIGSTLTVEATRVLQTAAGKMLFAKKIGSRTTKSTSGRSKTVPNKSVDTSSQNSTKTKRNSKRQSITRQRANAEDSLVQLANNQSEQ